MAVVSFAEAVDVAAGWVGSLPVEISVDAVFGFIISIDAVVASNSSLFTEVVVEKASSNAV